MKHFPLFLDLKGRRVLVVGAGLVAERKLALLLAAGARVTVVAEAAHPRVEARAHVGEITLRRRHFEPRWLDGAWLVIAATDDAATNAAVAQAAQARQLWCNVVDDADRSSAQVPAIVDRAPVTIAISSGGTAPVLARRLRARLEASLEPAVGALAALAGRKRAAIRAALPALPARRRFYDWLLDGPVMDALRAGRPDAAHARLDAALAQPHGARPGKVLLVGAGPGDPGLLTLRGLRALQAADVILHDRLASAEVLALARRDALRIRVGKTPGEDHEATQRRIHALMLEHARAGQCVVRLKGGDPLVYGRGGEEMQFLRAHGIAYEVVPGLTAALACAAYAGIPLTHRAYAHRVTLATAQRQHGADRTAPEPGHTRVYYMAVARLPRLCAQLAQQGVAPDTPCALVENGSRPSQRALHGTLQTIVGQARAQRIEAPALFIVGAAAALGPQLAWFGQTLAAPEPPDRAPQSAPVAALA